MANFLITGARAPVAVELVRSLAGDGHVVYVADSLRFPLARNTRFVTKTFYIVAPRESLSEFENDLQNILKQYEIDCLIPTCEEVFYISAIKPALEVYTNIFCPDFSLMKVLHSKYQIYSAAQKTGFCNPNSELVTAEELLGKTCFKGKVVKKEFCRFGSDVLIEPSSSDISRLTGSHLNGRFVIQDKIEGLECCTYAIARNGKVLFNSIYTPLHRVGKAAAIYFQPVVNEKISTAIVKFCENNNITGQIGFDVIVNIDGVFLLECNPRATSGLHLLSATSLSAAFLDLENSTANGSNFVEPKMVKLAMLLIGLPLALRSSQFQQFKRDYQEAGDVISIKQDRSFILFSLLSLLEIVVISLKTRSSLRAASTVDIEWDGEALDVQ